MPARARPGVWVLLIDPDERARKARANKLMASGYRVASHARPARAPRDPPSAHYEAIVVSARAAPRASLDWCGTIGRTGAEPLVIVLADAPFTLHGTFVPGLVICDRTDTAADEKLLAFLRFAAGDLAA